MRVHRTFSAVVICMWLLGFGSVAGVLADDFADTEARAARVFEKDEPIQFETRQTIELETEIGVKFTQALVVYKEHASITDTDSEWEAWMSRGDILASIYHKNDSGNKVGLEFDFGLFRTTTDEEDWDRDDTYEIEGQTIRVVDQNNDTEFSGWEFKGGVGYIQNFEGSWEIKHTVSYGRRVIEFKRMDFELIDINRFVYQDSAIAEEKYTIDFLEYKPQFTADIDQKWACSFSPGFAYVLKAKALNDVFDSTIDAEAGFIGSVDTKVAYRFTEFFGAYIGAMGEWQYLEGDTAIKNEARVEWPDNDLFTYGLIFGVTLNL